MATTRSPAQLHVFRVFYHPFSPHFDHFFPFLSLFSHIFYPFIHFRASTTPLQCLTIKTTTRITTTVNRPTSRTPRTIVTASQTTTTTPLLPFRTHLLRPQQHFGYSPLRRHPLVR